MVVKLGVEAKSRAAPHPSGGWEAKRDSGSDVGMGIEELLEGELVTTDEDFRTAEVSLKRIAKDGSFLVEVVRVVSKTATRGEFAGHRQLGISSLVVEGIVPLGALGGVGRPLQLLDEPFDREQPMPLEWDAFGEAVLVKSFGLENWESVDLDALAWGSGGVAGPNMFSGGVKDGVTPDVSKDSFMRRLGRRARNVGRDIGLLGGSLGGGAVRRGDVITVEVHRLEVFVDFRRIHLSESRSDGVVNLVIVDVGVVLNSLLELGIADVLDRRTLLFPKKALALSQPDVDKKVLPRPSEPFSEVGRVRAFRVMQTGPPLR